MSILSDTLNINAMSQINYRTGILFIFVLFFSTHSFSQQLIRYYDNYKAGFKIPEGKVIIPAKYDAAGDFFDGLATVIINNKRGYINTSGILVIEAKYEDAGKFNLGVAPVKWAGKYGLINKQDKWIAAPDYDDVYDMNEGLLRTLKNNKWGMLNSRGKVMIPFVYDDMEDAHQGLICVKLNGYYGFINTNGKMIIAPHYRIAHSFKKNNKAMAMADKGFYYIDKSGKILTRVPIAEDRDKENNPESEKDDSGKDEVSHSKK